MEVNYTVFNDGTVENIIDYVYENFQTIQKDHIRFYHNPESIQDPEFISIMKQRITNNRKGGLVPLKKAAFSDLLYYLFYRDIPDIHKEREFVWKSLIELNNIKLIELFLNRGLNPNILYDGKLPIIEAYKQGNGKRDIVKLLLKSPFISVSAKDADNYSIFEYINETDGEIYELAVQKRENPFMYRPVYLYSGHGFTTEKDFKEVFVPKGSLYINYAICGIGTEVFFYHIYKMIQDPYNISLQDPEKFKHELNMCLSTEKFTADISIYKPCEKIISENFYPIQYWRPQRNMPDERMVRIRSSGLISKRMVEGPETGDLKFEKGEFTSFTAKTLIDYFEGSIYPTQNQLRSKFPQGAAKVFAPSEITDLNRSMVTTNADLMKMFSGIHYNFMCRNIDDEGNVKAIRNLTRRRRMSIERGKDPFIALERSAVKNMKKSFLHFLIDSYDSFKDKKMDVEKVLQFLIRQTALYPLLNEPKEVRVSYIQKLKEGVLPIFLLNQLYDKETAEYFKEYLEFRPAFFRDNISDEQVAAMIRRFPATPATRPEKIAELRKIFTLP